ncbi:Eco57I restriction-modification methylase domain-containing protein [Pseudooceanicola nanhaiensis]|uniref:Eco57I restriction-modification methylase domain-containing protein n=1 Tax=Pseudooceanicola nanhaiensis TaxID=375761 RepID=UPI001CD513B7|nr:N-6 DNA methylase [Pseudooceanicola nanhaiensis]MCA0921980.1 N-6 DNA methylase [Pseudooceanicola nanhaiensis]
MARKSITDMSAWPSLSLEGNLIAPAMITKIDQRQAPEQSPEEYGVRKGLQIREEIATAFRVGQSHFDAFAKIEPPSAAATSRFIADFFKETFGYTDLAVAAAPVALIASDRVPVVVVPPSELLDRRSPTLSTDRSRSPAFALQDHLNDRDEALWGIVTNGMQLRLMRDNASLTRPAYIEADLAQMFINEDIASFAVLWLLIHRSRFGAADTPATDCPLERWRDAGSKEGEAARDRLADQVQLALKLLGSGFLEANPDLAAKLQSGEVNLTEWFNELLRLVYRLIFLMVAEDRNLLHPEKAKPEARALYAHGYSLQSLRKQCYRAATWDKHHDRYEGVKIVFRALTHGQPALALPALGGLFAEDRLPHLETARLCNRAFMEALYRLSWLADKTGMVPVNWRAMETEELGSVYESLLELQPQLGDDGKTLVFASEAAEQKGNQRKTTGSYYTPDSLVQALLDTALDPVLDKTEAEADDPAKALLKLSVIDPACGSGHFLLAAARRIATRLARIRAEGTPSLADFRHALRDVARCCIHGVDRNPMAVELTKVALWIETVDPGLPLGFFDAQIRCGDALLGMFDLKVLEDGIPDAAYKPLTGDDKDTAKYYKKANQDARKGQGGLDLFGSSGWAMPETKPMALDFSGFRDLPEDSVEQVGAKAKRFKELRKGQTFVRAKAAADLYVAAFLLPKVGSAPAGASERTVPTTEELWMALNQGKLRQAMVEAPKAARRVRAFHWPLEFPDIMERGGFDVVLGNPPWDTMSPDYKEFFSVYDPNIRHMSPEEQEEAYARLLSNPVLAAQWEQHCADLYAAVHFIKSSGRYRLFAEGNLGKGDFNVYRMFVETALAATRKGRVAAQFVPEGLYNGANATAIRRELFTAFRLEHLAGFENTKGIWFPSVHTAMKFSLYVAWKGGKTEHFNAAFRVNSSQKLAEFMTGNGLRIPVSVVKEFSPEPVAVMEFAAQSEIDICARMYALYPKFGADIEGVPLRYYMREVDMGTDRGLFSEGLEGLPVYEGRMIDAYDYRAKGYVSGRGRSAVWEDFPFGSPTKRILPQWRVVEEQIPEKLGDRVYRYRIGFGDVASPTNQRALVAALLPQRSVSGHKVPTIEFVRGTIKDMLLWLGVANSLVMDFLVRKKVSLTMSYTIMDSLPFPRDYSTTPSAEAIARRVCALCAVGEEMAEFRAQAVKAGILEAPDAIIEAPDQRAAVAAEIDVLVAREVFGQSKQEMLYILDPDNILGPDCGVETFKALRNAELREFKEFRTQRLIEEAWDRV